MGQPIEMIAREVIMERRGFVQDILDVKVLVLYVLARVQRPVSLNKIYELCFQDDKLSYFDLCEAVPQMVSTGHVRELERDLFEITDAGREVEDVMGETVAYPVAQRAKAAVEKFNHESRRSDFLRTEVRPAPEGEDVSVVMELMDESGRLMKLELMAPTVTQGRRLERTFREKAEKIYKTVLDQFLQPKEEN